MSQTEDLSEPILSGSGHYKMVARIIGDEVIGTQGAPVELLGGLIEQKFFPELWEARNRLTELANEE
jgi:tryptophan 2,3-dioxygenase